MNKYILIALIPLFFSCEKIFHENIYEDNVVPDTYQEKIDIIRSIYAHLVDVHDQHYFILHTRGDDMNHYWGISHVTTFSENTTYAEIAGNVYKKFYTSRQTY